MPYRTIATLLAERGYVHTFKQCWEKIKALKKKYKETMDKLRASGVGIESDSENFCRLQVVCRDTWRDEKAGCINSSCAFGHF